MHTVSKACALLMQDLQVQLRHIRHRHSHLPSQDEENQRLEWLHLEQKATIAHTPFNLAFGNASALRKPP